MDKGKSVTFDEYTRLYNQMNKLHDETKQEFAEVKADLKEVKAEVAEVKADLTEVKAEVAEVKADLTEVKAEVAEVKADLAEFKEEVRTEFTKVNVKLNDVDTDLQIIKNLLLQVIGNKGFRVIK